MCRSWIHVLFSDYLDLFYDNTSTVLLVVVVFVPKQNVSQSCYVFLFYFFLIIVSKNVDAMELLSVAQDLRQSQETEPIYGPRSTLVICPLSVLSNWQVCI